jgi:FixJ family two-component response regulator
MYRGKVLLVEDDLVGPQSIRPLVLQYIQVPCHIDVRNASQLLAGDYPTEENYLCIVLDLRLPNKTGSDVFEFLRARDQRVPILRATHNTERFKNDLRGIARRD